jgi:heme exporter protein D
MIWNSLAEFADMGGYALYVWGAYGMTPVVVGWELLSLVQRRRRATDELRDWQAFDGDDHDTAA